MNKFALLFLAVLSFGSAVDAHAVAKCRSMVLDTGYLGCQVCTLTTCAGVGWSTGNCSVSPCDYYMTNLEAELENADESVVTGAYFGERNSTNMSGSGRTTAAKAKLDACWTTGYSMVNSFSNYEDCANACAGANNVACQNTTGAEACEERCSLAGFTK